ncbi:MAG: RraA family protein [Bordetella sp.]|nr:RraA family protein [Bordetella sp.]
MSETPSVRLARLDACAVSDALDQLGLPSSVTGLRALSVRQRISGQVTTVRLAAGKPPADSPPRHLCTTAIDASDAGAVIVVEQKTGLECAGWGGILSNAARGRGISGVIVEGLARDVDEAADIDFPVYGRGATARTARGRIHEAETGGAISVGDLIVNQGDWVVADSSGAAFVPAASIEAVLDAAENIAAKEAAMTKAVLGGQPVSAVMGAGYEHLLEKKPGQ